MRHLALVCMGCLIVTACSSSPSRPRVTSGGTEPATSSSSAEASGSRLPFADHPIAAEEAEALRNVPPAQRAGKANYGVPVAQAGRVLDIGLLFGACSGQTVKVQTVVREAADRLVVTVGGTPQPRQAQSECGKVGMFLGLSVTLPSDERFTGTIEVRDFA